MKPKPNTVSKEMYVKLDARNRISLTKASNKLAPVYKLTIEGDTITLKPLMEIPERERWLYDPKNKDLVKEIKRRLREEKATIDLGSFKKYIKE